MDRKDKSGNVLDIEIISNMIMASMRHLTQHSKLLTKDYDR